MCSLKRKKYKWHMGILYIFTSLIIEEVQINATFFSHWIDILSE